MTVIMSNQIVSVYNILVDLPKWIYCKQCHFFLNTVSNILNHFEIALLLKQSSYFAGCRLWGAGCGVLAIPSFDFGTSLLCSFIVLT